MGSGGAIIGVDTGGTFTDVFTSDGTVVKVPSTPDDPASAILTALHSAHMRSGDAIAHGTTVATNAVLERKGARTALITTAGFEDVLEIRRQNRPSLYDLLARWPEPSFPPTFESERLNDWISPVRYWSHSFSTVPPTRPLASRNSIRKP